MLFSWRYDRKYLDASRPKLFQGDKRMTTSVTCKLDHAISTPLFLAAVLRASFLTDSLSAFAERVRCQSKNARSDCAISESLRDPFVWTATRVGVAVRTSTRQRLPVIPKLQARTLAEQIITASLQGTYTSSCLVKYCVICVKETL